jgi:hypothetical protein
MEKAMKTIVNVFFDDRGNVYVEHDTFCHVYNDGKHAAKDAKAILAEESTADWDGDESGQWAQILSFNCVPEDEWYILPDSTVTGKSGASEADFRLEYYSRAETQNEACAEGQRDAKAFIEQFQQEYTFTWLAEVEAEIEAHEAKGTNDYIDDHEQPYPYNVDFRNAWAGGFWFEILSYLRNPESQLEECEALE